MKTTLCLAFLLCLSTTLGNTSDPCLSAPAGRHLLEVNQEWKHHTISNDQQQISFRSDTERIGFHLLKVCELLRSTDSKPGNEQSLRRSAMIDTLESYALKGLFPVNSYHTRRQPYFIDIYGTHCAVGYLLKASGYGNIAREIAVRQNYAYVREIRSEELISWSKRYGFTVAELALIQPAYAPSNSYVQLEGGANGPVTCFYSSPYAPDPRLEIAGNFDMLNNTPCLNAGYYENDQLHCYGSGIAGTVNSIAIFNQQRIVAGSFPFNGSVYPAAQFDGTNWNRIEIPGRPGAVASTLHSDFSSFLISIGHPADPGNQEIWQYSISNGWLLKAVIHGTVYSISRAAEPGKYIYAGAFDQVTTIENGDAEIFSTKNILIRNQDQNGTWFETVQDHVSDTVFTVYANGGTLYFGGSASTLPGRSDVCLSRYLNGVSQPMLLAGSFDNSEYLYIKGIESYGNSDLIFTGSVSQMQVMFMYFGEHIFRINTLSGTVTPMAAFFDQPVDKVIKIGNTFFFGGAFTENAMSGSCRHLMKMLSFTGTQEEIAASLTVSPNPSGGMLCISGDIPVSRISITDMSGRKWMETDHPGNMIDTGELPSGAYLLHLETERGTEIRKWVRV